MQSKKTKKQIHQTPNKQMALQGVLSNLLVRWFFDKYGRVNSGKLAQLVLPKNLSFFSENVGKPSRGSDKKWSKPPEGRICTQLAKKPCKYFLQQQQRYNLLPVFFHFQALLLSVLFKSEQLPSLSLFNVFMSIIIVKQSTFRLQIQIVTDILLSVVSSRLC